MIILLILFFLVLQFLQLQIDENVVTITEEGTYILSGSLSDGMVIVNAEDTDKIQLVLDDKK